MNTLFPEITVLNAISPDEVRLVLHIPVQLTHFEGHFPELPILPGVVQVDWAVTYARKHLPLTGEFIALENLKFQGIVLPAANIALHLSWNAAAKKLNFRYTDIDAADSARVYSSGRIAFGGEA
jgi:3-hydroxymyristoyl/3-hydroxydecanoyl-(acyl carrier protein) dehydratase